jgi:hypothetical protein
VRLAITIFAGVGLGACQSVGQPPAAINSFCRAYQRVIRSPEEGASLAGAHRLVKERVAANDTLYRCECEHWDNPVCAKEEAAR